MNNVCYKISGNSEACHLQLCAIWNSFLWVLLFPGLGCRLSRNRQGCNGHDQWELWWQPSCIQIVHLATDQEDPLREIKSSNHQALSDMSGWYDWQHFLRPRFASDETLVRSANSMEVLFGRWQNWGRLCVLPEHTIWPSHLPYSDWPDPWSWTIN